MPDDPVQQQPDDQLPAPRPALGQEQWLTPQATPQATPPPGINPAMLRQPEPKQPEEPKQEQPKQDDEPKAHAITGMGPGREDMPQEKSIPDFLVNHLVPSGLNFIANTADAIIHAPRTIDDMGALLAGGVKAVARSAGMELPQNRADEVAQAFANYAKARWFSGPDQIMQHLYDDPVGMASDFSMVANLAGGVSKLAAIGSEAGGLERLAQMARKTSKVAGTAGNLTNPAWYATETPLALARKFGPKLPGAFDPKSMEFDPNAGPAAAPAPAPAPAAPAGPSPADIEKLKQEATVQRAQQIANARYGEGSMPGRVEWLQAQEDIAKRWKPPQPPKPPKPAATPKPAAQPAPAQNNLIRNMLAGGGVTGIALDLLTHHILGSIGGGVLGAAAVKYLPELLHSDAGQQMLARIGTGRPAQIAAVARELVPALHTIHQSQQPIVVDPAKAQQLPPQLQAKGGAFNDELARVQRERLRLPGIHAMLQSRE